MTVDRVVLSAIRFRARHGVTLEEQAEDRDFEVDVELACDIRRAARTDDLAQAIDYSAVHRCVLEIALGPPCRLLEALADRIARALLDGFAATSVRVRVKKLSPPGMPDVAWAGVEVFRRAPRRRHPKRR